METRRKHWTGDWRGGFALGVLCAGLLVPGLWQLPPIDRDEARFAEATRYMVAADRWDAYLVPMFDGRPRLSKPPLIYWLQAASVRAMRALPAQGSRPQGEQDQTAPGLPSGDIWAYRIVSTLAAALAVFVTWRLGLGMFAPQAAWWAGVMLAASLVVMVDARQARADQVLLALTTIAQASLWTIWKDRHRPGTPAIGTALLLWGAVALGAMTKGPVTPAVVLFTIVVLCVVSREWRWLKGLRIVHGAILVSVIILPWLVLVGGSVGWDTLIDTIGNEVLGRSVSGKEGHGAPPGYHLLLLPLCFWPGCLALAPGLIRGVKKGTWVRRAEDDARPKDPGADHMPARWLVRLGGLRRIRVGRSAESFCLAWIVPTWLAFELAATKLPHYALPTYPALALLCARGMLAAPKLWQDVLRHPLGRAGAWGWVLLCEVIAVVVPLALAWLGRMQPSILLVTWLVASVIVNQLLVAMAGFAIARRDAPSAIRWAVGSAVVLAATVFPMVLPNLSAVWLSSRLVQHVHAVDPTQRRPLAAAGYCEDSLVFLTAGRIERTRRRDLAEWTEHHPDGLVIIQRDPKLTTGTLNSLATVEGFNYSNGKWVSVDLVEAGALKEASRR